MIGSARSAHRERVYVRDQYEARKVCDSSLLARVFSLGTSLSGIKFFVRKNRRITNPKLKNSNFCVWMKQSLRRNPIRPNWECQRTFLRGLIVLAHKKMWITDEKLKLQFSFMYEIIVEKKINCFSSIELTNFPSDQYWFFTRSKGQIWASKLKLERSLNSEHNRKGKSIGPHRGCERSLPS